MKALKPQIGVGIVGLDNWYHAFAYAELLSRRCDLVLRAVSDYDEEKRCWIKNRYHVQVYSDHEKVLTDSNIDAVIITARTVQHLDLIAAAKEERKHILCDKPLEINTERATAVLQLMRNYKLQFCMSFPRRGRPLFLEAQRLISAGIIGEPICIIETGRYKLPAKAPGATDPGWYAEKDQAGGGGFVDHAVHQIDMMRWLLQKEAEYVVCAITDNIVFTNLPVEDYGIAVLRFGNTLVTVESSWISHGPVEDIIVIQGTEGALRLDVSRGMLEILGAKGRCQGSYVFKPLLFETPEFSLHLDGFDVILDSFIKSILNSENKPLASVEDGWRATVVITAIYETAGAQRCRPIKY